MVKFTLISFLCLFTCRNLSAQDTTGFRFGWGITVNPTGLISVSEPNVKICLEKSVGKGWSVSLTGGWFNEGRGYIAGVGVKNYDTRTASDPEGRDTMTDSYIKARQTNYGGIELLFRNHVYGDHEISYPDSGVYVESDRVWPITKQVLTIDVIGGTVMRIRNSKHFYMDAYWGLGLRFKNIEGFTSEDHHKIESWDGQLTMQPGFSVWPDVKLGVKFGYCIRRRSAGKK